VTVDEEAVAGTYWVQVVAGSGNYGEPFQGGAALQQSNRRQVVVGQATLGCPVSVVRGSTMTCTVTGAPPSSVTSWRFVGGGATVNGPNGTLTWGGVMVATGTITVSVAGRGTLSQEVTVNPRTWHTEPASPAQVPGRQLVVNGMTVTLPDPPAPTPHPTNPAVFLSGLGASGWQAAWEGFGVASVGVGPNAGFSYFPIPLTYQSGGFFYHYVIHPELDNATSPFSAKQCGVNGWISQMLLNQQTRRHEYNSPSQSHWAFYSNAMNSPS
jgi:hypothetical protein